MGKNEDNLLVRIDERVKTLCDNQKTIMITQKDHKTETNTRFEKLEEHIQKLQERSWVQFGIDKAGQVTLAGIVAKLMAAAGALH